MDILTSLRWRYATKKFDPAKKLTDDHLATLLEALRLAPSSFGLQPWKFIVVNDPELRASLRPHSWNQPQITDASHLIVLCARKTIDEVYIDQVLENIAQERGVPVQSLSPYRERILGFTGKFSGGQAQAWNSRQVYIALGQLITSAAAMGIDTCPIEGFDAQKYDEILGLEKAPYAVLVACALGYRAADDSFAKLPKARLPLADVVEER